jgi:hypothetical protein
LRICVREKDDAGSDQPKKIDDTESDQHAKGETEAENKMCLCGDVAYDILSWILSETRDAEGNNNF